MVFASLKPPATVCDPSRINLPPAEAQRRHRVARIPRVLEWSAPGLSFPHGEVLERTICTLRVDRRLQWSTWLTNNQLVPGLELSRVAIRVEKQCAACMDRSVLAFAKKRWVKKFAG